MNCPITIRKTVHEIEVIRAEFQLENFQERLRYYELLASDGEGIENVKQEINNRLECLNGVFERYKYFLEWLATTGKWAQHEIDVFVKEAPYSKKD